MNELIHDICTEMDKNGGRSLRMMLEILYSREDLLKRFLCICMEVKPEDMNILDYGVEENDDPVIMAVFRMTGSTDIQRVKICLKMSGHRSKRLH